ncbi:MAG: hypothetical protein LQ338_004689 [Usnochroma carphineum]|nr:MAG: hypothetical protein LQ338_004689 [Usnochroma carphineum]
MGNASSQLDPLASDNQPDLQRSQTKGSLKGKRSRDASVRKIQSEEQETAHNSMLPDESRPRTPQSIEDFAAASAQLLAESSSAPDFMVPATPEESEVSMNGQVSPQRKQGGRKGKRRLSAFESSLDAGNVPPALRDSGSEVSRKLDRETGFEGVIENGLVSPQRTFSLDDIDENEEGLSSLFQEYETQAILPISPIADAPENEGGDRSPFDQDVAHPAVANGPFGNKHKGKRKRRSGSDVSEIRAEQEHLNGTGQHAFEIDFATFDEIFANESMQLANPFNEESGYDLPNGIEPFGESSLRQADAEALANSILNPGQENQPTGKLPRISSTHQSRKRRRTEVPNSIDSQKMTYVSPYAPNEGQQDWVPSGVEDMQARSSSELPYSHPANLSYGIHAAPVTQQRNPTPPPPLEKPSKPRGNKRQRGGKKGKNYDPPLQEMSERGGMFSDAEIKVLDAFRDRYCKENNESHWRFNELIQSNIRGYPEVTRLFLAMHNKMPYRTRQSIIRFCRRHFHNFAARGSWTEADDDLLRDAIAKKGTSWKAVGEMIHRFPEDCRDRYRNYLVNGEKRNTEAWSVQEVRNLVKAVDFCMRLLRQQRVHAREAKYAGHDVPESESGSDQDIQDMKLINWQVVSDQMGGTRSRLQCSYKWNHLKNEDREKYLREVRRLEQGLKPREMKDNSGSWRLKRAVKKLNNMKPGDKYDFLQAFANCTTPSEKDIRWTAVGTRELRQRWSVMDFKAAMELFKREIPGSGNMNYQEVVNRVLTKLIAEHPDGLEDRWDPTVDGDVNKAQKKSARQEQRERRLWKAQNPESSSKFKSKEFVESDDEEEPVEEERSIDHEGKKEEQDDNNDGSDRHPPSSVTDSAAEGLNTHPSSEIGTSDEEQDGEHRSGQPSASTTDDRHPTEGVADSVEEGENGHPSSEKSVSDEERDNEGQSRHSSAATTEDHQNTTPEASSDSEGGGISTPTPGGKVAGTSSEDSDDDSLFNGDGSMDGELVDQLQQLHDAQSRGQH